jgi:glyoxylate reductase
MQRVVVTRAIPRSALELLDGAVEVSVSPHDRPLATPELHETVAGADAVLTMLHDRIDDALLEAAGPQLRCVANVAVGYDNVDVDAATRRAVVVTNTPAVLTEATADLAMALILAVTRRLGEGERLLRARTPWSWHMFFLLGSGLQGKTLGIVGLGGIGRATARRARAFGMNVVYSDEQRAAPEVEAELGGARHVSLNELLATSDVVSLHCPLTDATWHLIERGRLRQMRSGAYLINTARGPVVDELALVEALADGTIAGAALDVFEHEPDLHPGLVSLENVVLVPHLGSATVETRTAMAELAARNALAVLSGQRALTPVNGRRPGPMSEVSRAC